MPVALAPSGVNAGVNPTSLSGSIVTPPATFGGVPFSSLPAGNQAAILAAQGQPANNNVSPTASGDASATGMTGDSGGIFSGAVPPANDLVNAGITGMGFIPGVPQGAGFLASILKGIFQQATSGDEANTNTMSLADRALYGPGFGESIVNWITSLFSSDAGSADNADTNPASSQSSSLAGLAPGQLPGTLPPISAGQATGAPTSLVGGGFTDAPTEAGNPSGTAPGIMPGSWSVSGDGTGVGSAGSMADTSGTITQAGKNGGVAPTAYTGTLSDALLGTNLSTGLANTSLYDAGSGLISIGLGDPNFLPGGM